MASTGESGDGARVQAGDATQPLRHGTDPKLLELLICPVTKTSLAYDAARQELVSRAARLAFPIRDGVPLMTVEAARNLDDETGGAKS